MMKNMSMTDQDMKVLYDLSIYNCTHFAPYTQIIYEDQQQTRTYTNVELAREATQLSEGLRSLGIEKGDRVLIMMINSPEVLISYQALARLGAIAIPVLPLLKGPEVHYIARNSGANALLTGALLLPLLRPVLTGLPSMRYIISTGIADSQCAHEQTAPQVISYDAVLVRGAAKVDNYLMGMEGVAISQDDTAAILYTSGTTGNPKGVMLSHKNLMQNALSSKSTDPATETHAAHLAILPLAHAFGILVSNLAYLTGTKVVMHPRFDTTAVLSAIAHHRITAFAGVPAMFVALLFTPDIDAYDTSSLQYCVSGSAPLPIHILQGFEQKFHCEIREGYGLSEGTTALTGHTNGLPVRPGSVGKPLPGIEVRIVDPADNLLPPGEIGEVVARGPNVMQGYYNMPEETAATLRHGWLHTGDMGRFDEDGYLYIVERKKDLIIRGGLNVYPRDAEEILVTHPAVIEAAVIGVPSELMGEEVKAFVATRTPVEAETLMAYCRERLANYKTPSQLEFVHALPRNAIGKIDKKALRKLARDRQ